MIITRTTYHGEAVLETADLMLDAHHYDLEYVTTVAAVPGDPT